MKKIILLFILLSTGIISSARSIYDQFCDLNSNWKKQVIPAPLLRDSVFENDASLIRMHLLEVEKILRCASPEMTKEQKISRETLLDVLHDYALAGKFPQNTHHPGERRPYFIDDAGTACAVGFLIIESGNRSLAEKISDEHNYDFLRDIKTDGLAQWQQQSGFAFGELALIQPTYNFKMYRELFHASPPSCGEKYYSGKKLRSKGECKNGELHGQWKEYDDDGILRVEGNFEHGKRTGTWKTFDEAGELNSEQPYVDGFQHGMMKTYIHGQVTRKEEYKKGVRDGIFVSYSNGKILDSGNYVMGRRDGFWRTQTALNNEYVYSRSWYSNDTVLRAVFCKLGGDTVMTVNYNGKKIELKEYQFGKPNAWFYAVPDSVMRLKPNPQQHLLKSRYNGSMTVLADGIHYEITRSNMMDEETMQQKLVTDTVVSLYTRGILQWRAHHSFRNNKLVRTDTAYYVSDRQQQAYMTTLNKRRNEIPIHIKTTADYYYFLRSIHSSYGSGRVKIKRWEANGDYITAEKTSAKNYSYYSILHPNDETEEWISIPDTTRMQHVEKFNTSSWPDKRIRFVSEIMRSDSSLQGICTKEYTDSTRSVQYVAGKKNGKDLLVRFPNNYVLKTTEHKTWTNGELTGPAQVYDKDGKLFEEGQYKNGLREGNWTVYDVVKNTCATYVYEKGILKNTKRCSKKK